MPGGSSIWLIRGAWRAFQLGKSSHLMNEWLSQFPVLCANSIGVPHALNHSCPTPAWLAPSPSKTTHFFDQTALKPKVRFDIMAVRNPVQLKVSSAAEAMATPSMIGISEPTTGSGVDVPMSSCRGGQGRARWADQK